MIQNVCLTFAWVILVGSGFAIPNERSLNTVGSAIMQTFNQAFQKALTDRLAIETNHTVELVHQLQAPLDICKTLMKEQTQKCDRCTYSTCAVTVNSSSILPAVMALWNPLTYVNASAAYFSAMGNMYAGMAHYFAESMNFFGQIFGRRRNVNPDTLKCMGKCDDCAPVLLATQEEVITAVCGEDIITMNKTVTEQRAKILRVYKLVHNTSRPIIVKIDYETNSKNGQNMYTDVYITAWVHDVLMRYKSTGPFSLWAIDGDANFVATEYWNMA